MKKGHIMMKRFIALLGLLITTSALAADNTQTCVGNSCKFSAFSRTSGGSSILGLQLAADQSLTLGPVGLLTTSFNQAYGTIVSKAISSGLGGFAAPTALTLDSNVYFDSTGGLSITGTGGHTTLRVESSTTGTNNALDVRTDKSTVSANASVTPASVFSVTVDGGMSQGVNGTSSEVKLNGGTNAAPGIGGLLNLNGVLRLYAEYSNNSTNCTTTCSATLPSGTSVAVCLAGINSSTSTSIGCATATGAGQNARCLCLAN